MGLVNGKRSKKGNSQETGKEVGRLGLNTQDIEENDGGFMLSIGGPRDLGLGMLTPGRVKMRKVQKEAGEDLSTGPRPRRHLQLLAWCNMQA